MFTYRSITNLSCIECCQLLRGCVPLSSSSARSHDAGRGLQPRTPPPTGLEISYLRTGSPLSRQNRLVFFCKMRLSLFNGGQDTLRSTRRQLKVLAMFRNDSMRRPSGTLIAAAACVAAIALAGLALVF